MRIDGVVEVPGDKSISHRALILGVLARGRSYIGNLSPSADVEATAEVLRQCGGAVRPFGDGRVSLDGAGPGAGLTTPSGILDCANSGTTMRLVAGVLAGSDVTATLDGDGSLRRRPMERVAAPLRAMGAGVVTTAGTAPMEVTGVRTPRGLEHRLDVASAQVKSAILLAGLTADGRTTVVEPVATRDHTERLLRACGIEVAIEGTRVTLAPGALRPFGIRVPGDISAAAFLFALVASRPGWRIRCTGVGLNPGRTGVLDVLTAMGADVEVEEATVEPGTEPHGDVVVSGTALHAVAVEAPLVPRCIDEIPAIAVLASQADGVTTIRGAEELRVKESDRIAEVAIGLRALGVAVEEYPDGLAIEGPCRLRAAPLDSRGDHRLAMAWAIAGALVPVGGGDTVVAGAEAVAVSYPGFFGDLAGLSG
jgi:3-phosphoshikimate 1-carboxyvinyltransferase